jgi:hypothetical protein
LVDVSTYVVITLDTTAPVVTWGEPDGAVLGETFTIAYACDEPIYSPELRLSDGRVLAMADDGTTLSVELPLDTPEGVATVSVADDLGNEAHRAVVLSGVVPVPPPAPTTAPAGGLPVPAEHHHLGATQARASSRTVIRQRLGHASVIRARTADRQRAAVHSVERVTARTHWAPATTLTHGTRATLAGAQRIDKRSEGPEAEAELLLWL